MTTCYVLKLYDRVRFTNSPFRYDLHGQGGIGVLGRQANIVKKKNHKDVVVIGAPKSMDPINLHPFSTISRNENKLQNAKIGF